MHVKRRVLGALAGALAGLLAALGPGGALARESTPLTLDAALRLAMERAAAVVEATYGVSAAEIGLDREQEAFRARVSLTGRARLTDRGTRFDPSLSASGALGPAVSWSVSGGTLTDENEVISVSYQLWPPATDGANWRDLQTARQSLNAAEEALERARIEAALAAYEAYRSLQISEGRRRVAEAELEEARSVKARTEAGVSAGRASQSDLIRAEIDLLESDQRYVNSVERVETEKERLARLVGLDPGEFTTPPLGAEELAPAGDGFAEFAEEEVVAAVVAASTAVRDRRLALERAEEAVARARRDFGVGLSLNASVQPGSQQTTWSVGVNGTFALSDGGARRNALRSAELERERAERAYQQALQTAADEARTALRTLQAAQRSLEIALATERLYVLDVEAARESLRRGTITAAQLAARERALETARLNRAEAAADLELARMRLEFLMGRRPEGVPPPGEAGGGA